MLNSVESFDVYLSLGPEMPNASYMISLLKMDGSVTQTNKKVLRARSQVTNQKHWPESSAYRI